MIAYLVVKLNFFFTFASVTLGIVLFQFGKCCGYLKRRAEEEDEDESDESV